MFTFEDARLPPAAANTLLPGHVRQLLHAPGDELLVLQGLGVRVLDRSGAQRLHWAPERRVLHVARLGKEVVLTTPEGVFIAEVGADLGKAVTGLPHPGSIAVGSATHVAVLAGKAVHFVARATGDTQVLALPKEGVEALRQFDLTQLDVSPDGRWIYAARGGDVAAIWSSEGERVWCATGFDAPGSGFFVDTGQLVTRDGVHIRAQDPETPTEIVALRLPPLANDVTVAPAPGGLAVIHPGGVARWSMAEAKGDEGMLSAGTGFCRHASVGVETAAYMASDGLWMDGEVLDRPGGTSWFAVEARGSTVAFPNRDGIFIGSVDGVGLRTNPEEPALVGELDRTGDVLVLPCGPGHKNRSLHEISVSERSAQARGNILQFVSSVVRFGDRYAVCTTKPTGTKHWVGAYDFGSKRAAWKVKGTYPQAFAASPDCTRGVIAWGDGEHTVHELAKGKQVDAFRTARSRGLAVSDTTIATIDPAGRITLRRDGVETVVEREEPTEFGNLPLAFDETGAHLLVGASDGALEVRDATSGELQRTIPLHVGPFENVRVAGGKIFSLGQDGALKVVSL